MFKIKLLSHVLLLVMTCTLGACASPEGMRKTRQEFLENSKKTVEQAGICCNSFKEFVYEPLEFGKRYTFEFEKSQPVYSFKNGKSYYKAFSLPDRTPPYTISIRSHVIGGISYFQSYIFFPAVLFLDQNHVELAAMNDLPYAYELLWPSLRDVMTVEVQLADSMAKAKYMVIFTEPNRPSQSFRFTTNMGGGVMPITTQGGMMYVPTGGGSQSQVIPFSYEGKVSIKAEVP